MNDDDWKMLLAAESSGDTPAEDQGRLSNGLALDPTSRQLLDELRRDLALLHDLPTIPLERSLADEVLARIETRPIIQLPTVSRRRGQRWLGQLVAMTATAAATVLLWLAVRPQSESSSVPAGQPRIPEVAIASESEKSSEPAQVAPAVIVSPPADSGKADAPPAPRAQPGDVYTSRIDPPLSATQVARPRLSLPVSLGELGTPGAGGLATELKRESDHRIELFCKDPGRTAEEIWRNVRSRGLATSADPVSADAVRRKLRSAYAIYTESLSATECIDLLRRVQVTESRTESIVLAAITDGDRRELKTWLGIDPYDDLTATKADRPTDIRDKTGPIAFWSIYPVPKGLAREGGGGPERRAERSTGKLRLFVIVRGIGS